MFYCPEINKFCDGLINAFSYCNNPIRPKLFFLLREFFVDYSNINET